MKKIAFMFAAAAMFVACGENAPKVATAEQIDSIYNALKAECVAQAEAIVPEYVLAEGAEVIDSAYFDSIAQAKKDEILAKADTTNEEFKAAFEAAVKAFEASLNAPAAAVEAVEEAAEEVTEAVEEAAEEVAEEVTEE